MSSPYAGNPLNYPNDFPIPDDADPPTAAAVNPAFEALGDRTAWLETHIAAVNAFRTPLADMTALKAVLAPTDGLARIVEKIGVFTFDSSSILDERLPQVASPADMTPGRWLRAGKTLRNTQVVMPAARPFLMSTPPNTGSRDKYKEMAPQTISGSTLIARAAGGRLIMNQIPTGGASLDTYGFQWCLDEYLVQGATLTEIDVYISPTAGRAALPTQKISAGVFAYDFIAPVGSTLASLSNTGDFTEAQAPTVAAYEGITSIMVFCNQNNVIDKVGKSYFLQVWNEAGSNVLGSNEIRNAFIYQQNIVDSTFA